MPKRRMPQIVGQPTAERGVGHHRRGGPQGCAVGRVEIGGQGVDAVPPSSDVVGGPGQDRNRVAVGDIGHQRQQLGSDPVANEPEIPVGRIGERLEVEGSAEGIYAELYPGFTPFAFTNPIFVDADGDGAWSAPGFD